MTDAEEAIIAQLEEMGWYIEDERKDAPSAEVGKDSEYCVQLRHNNEQLKVKGYGSDREAALGIALARARSRALWTS